MTFRRNGVKYYLTATDVKVLRRLNSHYSMGLLIGLIFSLDATFKTQIQFDFKENVAILYRINVKVTLTASNAFMLSLHFPEYG